MLAQLGDTPRQELRARQGHRLSRAHAGEGRQLVRPLGDELHLRHMVGAVRLQRRRRRSCRRTSCARPSTGCLSIQNADGGWGEDGDSYRLDYKGYEPAPSTASQTAWALLGLMAAGEIDHPAVRTRHRLSAWRIRLMTASGTRSASPRRAFRASSICAITAIRNSSRFGRWRAIAT